MTKYKPKIQRLIRVYTHTQCILLKADSVFTDSHTGALIVRHKDKTILNITAGKWTAWFDNDAYNSVGDEDVTIYDIGSGDGKPPGAGTIC